MEAILARWVTKPEAAHSLGVTRRSMDRYLRRFQEAESDGLYDWRQSTYSKRDEAVERQLDSVLDEGRAQSNSDAPADIQLDMCTLEESHP